MLISLYLHTCTQDNYLQTQLMAVTWHGAVKLSLIILHQLIPVEVVQGSMKICLYSLKGIPQKWRGVIVRNNLLKIVSNTHSFLTSPPFSLHTFILPTLGNQPYARLSTFLTYWRVTERGKERAIQYRGWEEEKSILRERPGWLSIYLLLPLLWWWLSWWKGSGGTRAWANEIECIRKHIGMAYFAVAGSCPGRICLYNQLWCMVHNMWYWTLIISH